jgi:hypothetical protein
MGDRGPVPKRSDQRRRTNTPERPIDTAPSAGQATAPEADSGWHPVALAWYESLSKSGQHAFYEPSDWATAFLIAESMSRDLAPQFVGFTESGQVIEQPIPLKGASLSAYLKAMGNLLVTEGDRRRLAIELEKPKPADPDVARAHSTVTDIRSRLGA